MTHNHKQYGPYHEKTCFCTYTNNKGSIQTASPRSLINTFVVRRLDSITFLVLFTKFQALESFCGRFSWYVIVNPIYRVSRDEAHKLYELFLNMEINRYS